MLYSLTFIIMRLKMKTAAIPHSVKKAIVKLGQDIKTARLKRRIPNALLAERSFLGLSTVEKIQKGDPGVSIGGYAAVIFSLGLGTKLADLLSPHDDEVGLAIERERLPKRIRPAARHSMKSD